MFASFFTHARILGPAVSSAEPLAAGRELLANTKTATANDMTLTAGHVLLRSERGERARKPCSSARRGRDFGASHALLRQEARFHSPGLACSRCKPPSRHPYVCTSERASQFDILPRIRINSSGKGLHSHIFLSEAIFPGAPLFPLFSPSRAGARRASLVSIDDSETIPRVSYSSIGALDTRQVGQTRTVIGLVGPFFTPGPRIRPGPGRCR